jgi:hypothetical protein
MYRTVKAYQTADGQAFPTKELAEQNALNLLSSELEIMLNGAFQGENMPEVAKAAVQLASDPAHLRVQLEGLLKILDHRDPPKPNA